MDTWTKRLANYLREHGPVGVVCVIPRAIEKGPRVRYRWQAQRGVIRLSPDGEPEYGQQKAGPLRRSFQQADLDVQKIAAEEQRILFHWVPGRLNSEKSEELLAVLADMTGQHSLWP